MELRRKKPSDIKEVTTRLRTYAFDFALAKEGNALTKNLLQDAANKIDELKQDNISADSDDEKLANVLRHNAAEYLALEKENETMAEILLMAARTIEKLEKEREETSKVFKNEEFGSVLNFAVRYALNETGYEPNTVATFISPVLPHLNETTLISIEHDVKMSKKWNPNTEKNPIWNNFSGEIKREIERRKNA